MLSEQNLLYSLFLCQRFIMQMQQKGAVYHTTDVLHAAAEKKRRPKLQENTCYTYQMFILPVL